MLNLSESGPTTAGSIKGTLKLDASDWFEKLAAADAAARKLGAVDPTVRVGAETGAADSKLAATQAAVKRLGAASPNIQVKADIAAVAAKLAAVEAAERKLALAADATRISYLRLDEVQGKEGVSALRVAAAHLSAARAEEAEKNATDRLAAAKLALAAAENASAAAIGEADRAQSKANSTHSTSLQRWQLIAVAIAALIPLLAPLSAYVVGVGGAFAGMGAAGVLAIYGIVAAVKNATIVGDQYKAGLSDLKGVLDSLGTTAANGMLQYFGLAVQTITRALPELNRQIGTFTNILGQTGLAVLDGVIGALRIMNPLFVQGAQYVRSIAQGFNSWVQNGGLNQFVNYAIAKLPVVADMLGSLASAAVHIVTALSPLGTVAVAALKLLGDTINAIPSPVLLDVASAAAAGFAAFKLWNAVVPILEAVAWKMGALGVAAQVVSGPIGWVTAGISALAAVAAVSVTAMQDQSQAANDYAQALQQDNGAIKENVRLTAVKNLHDSGAIKNAHELGISTSDLTEAAVGNADAMRRVNAVLDGVEKSLGATGSATGNMTAKQNDQAAAMLNVREQLGAQSSALDSAKSIQQENADAVAGANTQIANSSDLLGAMKSATDKAADATDKLSQKLRGLGQVNLDASSANIQYQQSIADASAALEQNGATLDTNTQKGRDNQRALDGIASSGIALVAAQAAAGASAEQLSGQMQTVHDQFVNAAVGAGMSRDAAEKMATQYGLVPKDVSTAFNTSGIPQAKADAAALQAAYEALQKVYTIRVNTITTNATNPAVGFGLGDGHRDGGTIHAADGMTVPGAGSPHRDSVPSVLAPGEEVISNRNGQASFWRSALKLMNSGNRLGVAQEVARLAGVAPGRPQSVTNVTHNHTWHVTASDPNKLTQAVAMRLGGIGA